jgi:2-polyprenyl-3-methyl-5-hydroxy-6-metoxy-1,4-benzoquinol methylase
MNQKSRADSARFENLRVDDFERMALDPSLSAHEKIGFPDSYREGFEDTIYRDIRSKLSRLDLVGAQVLDIGPGCAGLPRKLIEDCASRSQTLVLVDVEAMLSQLPSPPHVRKIAGTYPACRDAVPVSGAGFDAILCYSVLHYVFIEAAFWRFIDCSLALLAPGGQMLIGDIPNVSKRKRFFSSAAGVRFHQAFMQTGVEVDRIDDAVLQAIVARARAQGCDAYWLPQPETLPMSNRREDILICRP